MFSIRGKQRRKRSLICRRKSIETIRDLSSEKNNEKKKHLRVPKRKEIKEYSKKLCF